MRGFSGVIFQLYKGDKMAVRSDQLQKSRLGRLLVIRGFISERQLDQALWEQGRSGKLLGEVLIAKGWVSQVQLDQVLKQQKRYRKMAAVVALVAAPLQPMLAVAASPSALPLNNTRVESTEVQNFGAAKGLQMLDDEEMAGVSAQGFVSSDVLGLAQTSELMMNPSMHDVDHGLQNLFRDQKEQIEEKRDEKIAQQLTDTVLTMAAGMGPISQMLDADITIKGLKYAEGRAPMEVLGDGRIKFYMPTEIERISMENIRVKGSDDAATMGSIYMSDIKFFDSNYTISTKRN